MPRAPLQFNGYSVAFSPFEANRVAVAAAQNFGIVGNGCQQIFAILPGIAKAIVLFAYTIGTVLA